MITYQSTTAQERAILRAVVEQIPVQRIAAGVWLAGSTSRPGTWHLVRDGRCDCEAAQAGRECKHVAAVEMAQEERTCRVCNRQHMAMYVTKSGVCPACSVDELFGKD